MADDEAPESDGAPPPDDDDAPGYLTGDHDERLETLRQWQEKLKARGVPPPGERPAVETDPDPFAPVPLCDLPILDISPDDRIWGDVITKGCITIMAGQPGIGKSTLLRYVVKAVAEGSSYLGRQTPVGGAAVLVIDYETPDAFRRAFWRDVYGDEIENIQNIHVAINTPPVSVVGPTKVIEAAAAIGAALVVVDTISAAFLVENENDNSEMEQVVRTLRAVAKAGFAVLVVGHPSKGGSDLRGASALKAGIDVLMTYATHGDVPEAGPDEGTQFLLATKKNRTGDMGAIEIQWDGAGGFVAPKAPTDTDMAHSEVVVEQIVAMQRPEEISLREILDRAAFSHIPNSTARWALKRLLMYGLVRKIRHGVYG